LVYRTDIITFYLMAAGVLFLVFYTWPLKYMCYEFSKYKG